VTDKNLERRLRADEEHQAIRDSIALLSGELQTLGTTMQSMYEELNEVKEGQATLDVIVQNHVLEENDFYKSVKKQFIPVACLLIGVVYYCYDKYEAGYKERESVFIEHVMGDSESRAEFIEIVTSNSKDTQYLKGGQDELRESIKEILKRVK